MTDLLEYIEWSSLECLNQNPSHPVVNALKQGYREDDGLLLQSDVDEQLLLHIRFNQAVKLNAFAIKAEGDCAPRRVKLFVNKPSLGFSEAADYSGVQEFELSPSDMTGNPLPLKFVKFQNVTSLEIFIEDNQGEEEVTKVQKIAIFGISGETMNVSEIKKVGEEDN